MRKSKYSQEFQDSTVQLIINNNESVVKVAEDLDLNPKTMNDPDPRVRGITFV